MSTRTVGVVLNGVTGRMGYNQHLVRSILAINAEGGVALSGGDRVVLEPMLVGRSEAKLRELCERHAPWPYDFVAGARGVQLAEQGLRSSAEGRRVELPELAV